MRRWPCSGPSCGAGCSRCLSRPLQRRRGVREVAASERGVISLQTRLRYTTMIVLPESEEILDVICGDKDFWIISSTQNIAHIKPAKEGAATNLNLVTKSGAIYSFLLTEKVRATGPEGVRRGRDDRTNGQAEVLLGRASGGARTAAGRGARRARRRPNAGPTRRSAAFRQEYPRASSSRTARPSTRSRSSCDRCGTTASSPT